MTHPQYKPFSKYFINCIRNRYNIINIKNRILGDKICREYGKTQPLSVRMSNFKRLHFFCN